MQVNEQLDAGPIFMQGSVDIGTEDNYQTLHDKLSVLGSELLLKVLDNSFVHSFSILSDDRSRASSKTMPPYSAMQSLLLQMRISSPVLKVIQ